MTSKWYKTASCNDGSYLNNPEETTTTPSNSFEVYEFPKIWNKFMTNTEGILIDETTIPNNYIFMSNNPNQLEQLVNIWNSFTEQAADYIDWE